LPLCLASRCHGDTAAQHRYLPRIIVAVSSAEENEMDVLQINWMTFLMQVTGLAMWIFLAAAIYALVENYIDRRGSSGSG